MEENYSIKYALCALINEIFHQMYCGLLKVSLKGYILQYILKFNNKLI